MLNHCQTNPEHTVVYLHTKGTGPNNHLKVYRNSIWRHYLTEAAMKPSCIEALQRKDTGRYNDTCDACGLQMYPIWTIFYPGNIFSARCSYIAKLLPLLEFRKRLTELVMVTNSSGSWKHTLYSPRDCYLGTDRFANEAWIGSHPTGRFCDMSQSTTKLYQFIKRKGKIEDDLHAAKVDHAPRTPMLTGNWYQLTKKLLPTTVDEDAAASQPIEYFLLGGLLYRVFKVYASFPPGNSWLWDWFPNGAIWKEKVDRAVKATASPHELNESLIWGWMMRIRCCWMQKQLSKECLSSFGKNSSMNY